ncbi:MAG TPA: hydroxymethylbilane synthase [Solirubrobacteraceae bacterium]|nr:hydroxymethylbilane synthase [Solirubrobacteraceae bacterium]
MRIGTRGSALALAQAGAVSNGLGPGHELVLITTSGDRDRAALDKERWVRELDEALLRGDVDLAVHSAKDVPADLPAGIVIAAVPIRAPAVDALCGAASLDALPAGARVGTASLRREAQLRALRDDLVVTELRGNVGTRLQRLHAGDYDAIVLALAGLERLARDEEATGTLPEMVPCAGQGALLLAARADDEATLTAARHLDDPATHACLRAEREVVRGLDADCHTPMGAHATLDEAGTMTLTAFVGRPDGGAWLRDTLTVAGGGAAPEALGAQVAARLVAAGAQEVLGR